MRAATSLTLLLFTFDAFNRVLGQAPADSREAATAFSECATETARLKLGVVPGEMCLAPDGKSFYTLDLSAGRALRISTADLSVMEEEALPGGPVSMTIPAKGGAVYVATQLQSGGRGDAQTLGKVLRLDPVTLKTQSELEIPTELGQIAATDSGLVFCASFAQSAPWIADFEHKESAKKPLLSGAYFVVATDQTRLFLSEPSAGRGVRSAAISGAFRAKDDLTSFAKAEDGNLGGPFRLTPDGKFVVVSGGRVTRLGKLPEAEPAAVGKIEPWIDACGGAQSARYFVLTRDQHLVEYELPAFTTKRTMSLPVPWTTFVFLPEGNSIIAHVALPRAESVEARGSHRFRLMAGDFVAWKLRHK